MKTSTILIVTGVGGLGAWALWRLWKSSEEGGGGLSQSEYDQFISDMAGSDYVEGGLQGEFQTEQEEEQAAQEESAELTCAQLRRRVVKRMELGQVRRAKKLYRIAKARGCPFTKGQSFKTYKRKYEEAVAIQEQGGPAGDSMVGMDAGFYNPNDPAQPAPSMGVSSRKRTPIQASQWSRLGRPPTAQREPGGGCPPGYEFNLLTGTCTLIVE